MRHRRSGGAGIPLSTLLVVPLALLLGGLLLAGCGLKGDEEEPEPVTEPEPAPEPEPEPEPPAADAIGVALAAVHVDVIGNEPLLNQAQPPPDQGAVDGALETARATLEHYLNVQFVDPATRFSSAGLDGLLAAEAHALLDDDSRRTLGMVAIPLAGLVTHPVAAAATILVDGAEVLSVTLAYEASMEATLTDGTVTPLVQRGSVLLVPADDGWRALAADLTLDGPEAEVHP